jgi:DNA-directed RNA polymerase II subunit RPB1
MEDCKINYDYTVRNASGSIVQFLYGEDGVDPTKIESQQIPYIDLDYDKLCKEYLWTSDDDPMYYLDEDTTNKLKGNKQLFDRLKQHFDQIVSDREFMIVKIFDGKKENSIFYPISFFRIITIARSMFQKHVKGVMSDLEPGYVLDSIDTLCNELFFNKMNRGNKLLQILLRAYLSPKKVCFEYKFDKLAFDYVVKTVKMRFYESIANPSDMIGIVAAQSIGEPCTQLTLNTFHSSGISSASKTVRGVPRIKELLSVTRNIKSPSMTIYIKDSFNKDKRECTGILNSIQTTYFKDIVTSTKIYFDPDDFNTTIEDDKLFLATYKEFIDQGMIEASNLSPWLLRLEFDKGKLHDNGLTMMDIHYTIHDFYEDSVNAMFSDDNAQNLVCRIKLPESESEETDMITKLKALEKSIMENIVIKGIENVNKVMMNKKESMKYNKETMKFDQHYEWVLDTSGTNLIDIMCHPKIDTTRTISNDIHEIYETLGVEAARQVLLTELYETLADLYVNYRHIALLVDTMTNKGYLLSIDRHGINRVDIGPLAKCSFEETTDMLIKAGIFSDIDKINGVSANIMLGQILPAGTGDTDILIDEQKIIEMHTINEEPESESELENEGYMSHIDDNTKDNICSLENLDIDFKMPEIDKSFLTKKMDVSIKIV